MKVRIAIHEGKCEIARELISEKPDSQVGDRFWVYLRSVRNLEGEDNQIFYIRECLRVFRNNMDVEKYQPIYAHQK